MEQAAPNIDNAKERPSILLRGEGLNTSATPIPLLIEGEHVLDLGSGKGINVMSAAAKVGPTGQVVGVDACNELVTLARQNAALQGLKPPHIAFIEGDLNKELPIAPDSVDYIISDHAIGLLSLSEKAKIMKEAYLVLRPGGRIYVGHILTTHASSTEGEDGITAERLSVPECKQLFSEAGFKEVSLIESDLYQIYASKPGMPTGERPDMLLRWWDAFPTVISTPPQLSAEEVETLVRHSAPKGGEYAVIDVRRNDHVGGHVRGSYQWPAQTFHGNLPQFFEEFKSTEKVIFYCGSSHGRGPRCAGWYQDYLDGISAEQRSKAYVLKGGVKNWLAKFRGQEDLVDYD